MFCENYKYHNLQALTTNYMKKTIACLSKKYGLLILTVFMCSALLNAQIVIKGKITDRVGTPLQGASVAEKSSARGTVSDANGEFLISIKTTPAVLIITRIGYRKFTKTYAASQEETIVMEEEANIGSEVVVSASRIRESILKSPVTIEKVSSRNIRESAAPSFFDALNNVKGVDLGTQSIGFKSVNMRGFGANNNTRVIQLVDGMDNRSPGLGFPFGNVVGVSELDVDNIEIIPGAASVLYGPDALNGAVLTTTKDPFTTQGLSIMIKQGFNHISDGVGVSPLSDVSLRYAKNFDNKFAFKLNAQYFRATDWYANSSEDRMDRGRNASFVPGARNTDFQYDGLNLYGDEYNNANSAFTFNAKTSADSTRYGAMLGKLLTRTGYAEKDLASYNSYSAKVGGSLNYKITKNLEAILDYNFGKGNAIQTPGQRTYFPAYTRNQIKLELNGTDFFLRAYTTQQTNEGYGLANIAYALNTISSPTAAWALDYADAYNGRITNITGSDAAAARTYADRKRIYSGTSAFTDVYNEVSSKLTTQTTKYTGIKGARQLDNSDMFHYEGMYNFSRLLNNYVDVVTGASFRYYKLNSQGTYFPLQADGSEYTIKEYGAYLQVAKNFNLSKDVIFRPSVASRYDKNQFIKGGLTPRATGVLTIKQHNFRVSYQTAFRNPSPNNLFAYTSTELGGSDIIAQKANLYSNPAYLQSSVVQYQASGNASQLVKYVPSPIKTEKIKSFEVGYKALLYNKLYIDAYYYHSTYTDFIANQNIVQPKNGITTDLLSASTSATFALNSNNANQVYVNGVGIGVDYNLPSGFKLSTNYSFAAGSIKDAANKVTYSVQDGLKRNSTTNAIVGRQFFNSPKNRYNITLSKSSLISNSSFAVTYRWQDKTWWEQGFSGDSFIPSFSTVDAQYSYHMPATRTTLKIGGSNIFNKYYVQGYGLPSVGALYYVSVTFDDLLRMNK